MAYNRRKRKKSAGGRTDLSGNSGKKAVCLTENAGSKRKGSDG